MKSFNFLAWCLFCAVLFLISCDENNPEPHNSFVGKNYDEKLLGEWERTSMSTDLHNSITLVSDKILFQEANTGSWERRHFDEMQEQQSFTYYTEQDSLWLQIKHEVQLWSYLVREDTLIMTSPIPDSLKHLDIKYYTSNFIKIP